MGVYFIAAGTGGNNPVPNRERTLDKPHSAEDLAPRMPVQQAARLLDEFPNGKPVFAWGATGPSLGQLRQVKEGDYVVDVANSEVRGVFRFAFGYETPDESLQEHFKWDAALPHGERRLYPYVYFLTDRTETIRTEKRWFQWALDRTNAYWLTGQKYFSDVLIEAAMRKTGLSTVENLLGIEPSPPSSILGKSRESGDEYKPRQPQPVGSSSERSGEAGTGQGYGLTGPERKAVERCAMAQATAHYSKEWDTVEDVGDRESYDLQCRSGERELRVEVKGTTGSAASVLLTRNEVDHARGQYPNVDLFVVSEIQLEGRGTGEPRATGGALRVFSGWDVDDPHARLLPETYRFTLPESS